MNDNGQILQELGKLQGTVEEGFKSTHHRQDTANHRTAKNEAAIEALKDHLAAMSIQQNTNRGDIDELIESEKDRKEERKANRRMFYGYIASGVIFLAATVLQVTGILNQSPEYRTTTTVERSVPVEALEDKNNEL